MRTKIIPFDIELAKKIQSGEIKGEIKTIHGYKVRIICWDRADSETPVVLLVQYNDWEGLHSCNIKGEYMEGGGDDVRLKHLVLEVLDNEPMVNVGDTVSINIINSSYDADFRTRYHSKLATVLFTNKYGAGVKTIISGDENYFPFNELMFVRRDAKELQFKPFDKVLVRNDCNTSLWKPSLFIKHYPCAMDNKEYFETIGEHFYELCIPYEGNEHLIGTTDNPE